MITSLTTGGIQRHNANGTTLWTKTINIARTSSQGAAIGFVVCSFPDGGFALVGVMQNKSDPSFSVTFGPGESAATTLQTTTRVGFLARYRSNGTLLWAKSFADHPGEIAADGRADGSLIVRDAQGISCYLASGALSWSTSPITPSPSNGPWSRGNNLESAPDGSFVYSSRMYNSTPLVLGAGEANETTISGFRQAYAARFGADGKLCSAIVHPATGFGSYAPTPVAFDDSMVIAGAFYRTVVFGPGEPNATTMDGGFVDGFVARWAGGCQGSVVLSAPTAITQECDGQGQGATVNFVVEIQGNPPSAAILVVKDLTGARTLLTKDATPGTHGVGPYTFPQGASNVVVSMEVPGTGTIASEPFVVTIQDTVAPVLSGCTDKTIECQGTQSLLSKSLLGISATDACDANPTIGFAPALLPLGTTTVTVTAKDETGNADSCQIQVTVRDTLPPVFTLVPDDIERECTGAGGHDVTFEVTAEDACDNLSLTCKDQTNRAVNPAGTHFDVGVHTVTCTATDGSGNSSFCTFRVTIIDNTKPVITCPNDITVGNDSGQCFAKVAFTVTATDACDPNVTPVCEAPWGAVLSGDQFPVGTTTVVCTAKDKSGNEAQSAFSITVEDREAPVITTPAGATATVVTDCKGSDLAITANAIGTAALDNCDGIVAVICSPAVLSPGTDTVTCTAVDAAGNQSVAKVQVTVLKGAFDWQALRPTDLNVDNLIKAGQTVALKVRVSCEGTAQKDVIAKIAKVEQLGGSGTPIANVIPEDSGLSSDDGNTMRLSGDNYTFNLSTKNWVKTGGIRHRVTVQVSRAGHVDTICEIHFVNK